MSDALERLARSLCFERGEVRLGEPTVFCIAKNEMFFFPLYLSWYRGLGIRQFLILDDGSTDGSLEFLAGQPDVVVLRSSYSFGEVLEESGNMRAGQLLKRVMSQELLRGTWCIYADPDEYLFLPPKYSDIHRFLAEFSAEKCFAASLVEFYPAIARDLFEGRAPKTTADLFAEFPFFDQRPLVRLVDGSHPQKTNRSFSERLLTRLRNEGLGRFRVVFENLKRVNRRYGDVYKTPVFRSTADVFLRGSHDCSVPPCSKALLSMAHFKWTRDLPRRARYAVQSGAYARGSERYRAYSDALRYLQDHPGYHLDDQISRRFEGSSDLVAAGLMSQLF